MVNRAHASARPQRQLQRIRASFAIIALLLLAVPPFAHATPLSPQSVDSPGNDSSFGMPPQRQVSLLSPGQLVPADVGDSTAGGPGPEGASAAAASDSGNWRRSAFTPDETFMQALQKFDEAYQAKPQAPGNAAGGRAQEAVSNSANQFMGIQFTNEWAVDALRAVVDVRSTDGRSYEFSVLGLGDFVLQRSSDQVVTLSEINSGLSVSRGPSDADSPYSRQSDADDNGDNPSLDGRNRYHLKAIIDAVVDFVTGPEGIFLGIAGLITLMLAGMVKTVAAQRTRMPTRVKAYEPRRQRRRVRVRSRSAR